jgi:hypothetical protein
MNEELSAGVNRLLFYFFILHSYFFICFWSPPCRPIALTGWMKWAMKKISRPL